jgi:CRP/FNR family transcriptional regulator, cyclic AMP receptor protein
MAVVPLVRMLDADPGLADGLDRLELRQATHHLVVRLWDIPGGPWMPPASTEDLFGLLLLDGLLLRRVSVVGRSSVELLGEGDLIRPWQPDEYGIEARTTWHGLASSTVAVLDREFVTLAARWPEILVTLASRAIQRSRSLAVRLAIAQAPSVTARVVVVLCHLADRWGHVTSDGTVLPIPLSQGLLGELVAARRQSVCLAVGELQRHGLLWRAPGGSWILRGSTEEALAWVATPASCLPPDSRGHDGDPEADACPAPRFLVA